LARGTGRHIDRHDFGRKIATAQHATHRIARRSDVSGAPECTHHRRKPLAEIGCDVIEKKGHGLAVRRTQAPPPHEASIENDRAFRHDHIAPQSSWATLAA
jgi:hypothetical protein